MQIYFNADNPLSTGFLFGELVDFASELIRVFVVRAPDENFSMELL